MQMPPYYKTTQYPTGQHHLNPFITPVTSTTAYIPLEFFPRTIKEWNNIPTDIIEILALQNNSLMLYKPWLHAGTTKHPHSDTL